MVYVWQVVDIYRPIRSFYIVLFVRKHFKSKLRHCKVQVSYLSHGLWELAYIYILLRNDVWTLKSSSMYVFEKKKGFVPMYPTMETCCVHLLGTNLSTFVV